MAVSLAEKLGSKDLLAYSLHPGVISSTSLSTGLEDLDTDFAALSRCLPDPHGLPVTDD